MQVNLIRSPAGGGDSPVTIKPEESVSTMEVHVSRCWFAWKLQRHLSQAVTTTDAYLGHSGQRCPCPGSAVPTASRSHAGWPFGACCLPGRSCPWSFDTKEKLEVKAGTLHLHFQSLKFPTICCTNRIFWVLVCFALNALIPTVAQDIWEKTRLKHKQSF